MNKTVFNTIKQFINDVADCYEEEYKPVALYRRLLSQTTLEHEKPVEKHISTFTKFCDDNVEAIEKQDETKFSENTEIRYSDNVFIDMKEIFSLASPSDKKIIWKHLLVISMFVVEESNAKGILVEQKNKAKDNSKEKAFINNIIDDVATKLDIDPNDNGANLDMGQMMQKMMSSGIVTDLFSTVQNEIRSGNLDTQEMMNSAKDMMQSTEGVPENAPDMGEMVNTIVNTLGGPEGMASMMNQFLSGMQPPQQ